MDKIFGFIYTALMILWIIWLEISSWERDIQFWKIRLKITVLRFITILKGKKLWHTFNEYITQSNL